MPRRKGGGKKKFGNRGGVEYCKGYVDEYGAWNNGFQCPKWGGPDEQYCCGDSSRRYCCPQPTTPEIPVYNGDTPGASKGDGEVVDITQHPVSPSLGPSINPPPMELAPSNIPLIGGVFGAIVILTIIIISCFLCRCCPGYKKFKRQRPRSPTRCSHCNTTIPNGSVTGPQSDMLACGCRAGDPQPHRHNLQNGDLMLTLFENPDAVWQTDVTGDIQGEFPMDDPPPYTVDVDKQLETGSGQDPDLDSQKSETDILRGSNPNMLCLASFRPLSMGLTSPTTSHSYSFSTLNRTRRQNAPGAPRPADQDQSKRDSGLVEDQDQNDQEHDKRDQSDPESDHESSIVVPKFHFQSLNLCRSGYTEGGNGTDCEYSNRDSIELERELAFLQMQAL